MNLKLQTNDISFGNIFWRKFVIRLLILLIVSFLVLHFGQNIVVEMCEKQINDKVVDASLQLAQIRDCKIPNNKFATSENIILAELHESIQSSPFVVDSSISFYDLTNGTIVSKSFEVPIVCSSNAIDWWKEQTNLNDQTPTVSLTDDAMNFCRKYKNCDLYIEDVWCVNSILIPYKVVAKDNGKVLDNHNTETPSYLENTKKYDGSMQIKIIGNQREDNIYGMMLNASLHENQLSSDSAVQQNTDNNNQMNNSYKNTISIVYPNGFNDDIVKMTTKNFTINNTEYQVDCGYQVNFWFGAWKLVAIAEIICVLLCAASAFINTKETLTIYQ